MRIALFEPDIPQNLGAVMRIAACFEMPLDVIEPCGFPLDEKRIMRVAMDYYRHVNLKRHASWNEFKSFKVSEVSSSRLVLFTTKTESAYYDFNFRVDDILLFGRESGGVPQEVVDCVDEKLTIPISSNVRSLNLATSVAIASAEAKRQLCLKS